MKPTHYWYEETFYPHREDGAAGKPVTVSATVSGKENVVRFDPGFDRDPGLYFMAKLTSGELRRLGWFLVNLAELSDKGGPKVVE